MVWLTKAILYWKVESEGLCGTKYMEILEDNTFPDTRLLSRLRAP